MQKIKGVILVALMAITISGYSQVTEKGAMVKRIFEVIKNNDEEGFVKLFPDAATLRGMMEAFMKLDTSAVAQESIKAAFESMTDSSLQISFRKDFKRQLKKGEDIGIDWRQADLVSFTADSSMVNEDGMNTTMLKGKIYFKAASKDYFMAFDEIIWFENKGWYGVSIRRVDEKSKENEPEESYVPMASDQDSIAMTMMAADSMARVMDEPPPPKKPVLKQQPAKKKPVKPKTSTPARKPE